MRTKLISLRQGISARASVKDNLISDVALMTVGPAAGHFEKVNKKEHQLAVDDITLQMLAKLAEAMPDGIPFRCNLATMDHAKGPICGRILPGSVKIVDGSLRGDVELEKKFRDWEHIAGLAETQPTNIGVSFEFNYFAELIADNAIFRPTEIFCATLVDRPAANPQGLLSENPQTTHKTTMEKEEVEAVCRAVCAEVMAPMTEQLGKMAKLLEGMTPPAETKPEEKPTEMAALSAKLDKITALISATTGNPAAALQAKTESTGTRHAYLQRVEAIKRTEGVDEAKARALAIHRFGDDYNKWMAEGAPAN